MSPSKAAIGLYHMYGRGERLALRQFGYCARSAKKEKAFFIMLMLIELQQQQQAQIAA